MKRFGRSEQGRDGILLWSVYEAEEEGDFRGGRCVASFLRTRDALAFQEAANAAVPDLVDVLIAAGHALRSYQHGNAAPDLAEEVADRVEATIAKVGVR